MKNEMEVIFDSRSENESFARVVAAAFLTQIDPVLEEVADVKTAISEAVTNAIIHGYEGKEGKIHLKCRLEEDEIQIAVIDHGKGIADIKKAMEPLFTTAEEQDRSGLGFVFMEAFMDQVTVESVLGEGTCVRMKKKISKEGETWNTPSL